MLSDFRKTLTACTAAVALAFTCAFLPGCGQAGSTDTASTEQQVAFTETEVPTFDNDGETGTIKLRYYEDMPNVPYVSLTDFHNLMNDGVTATAQHEEDGTWTISSPAGSATVDTNAETFSSDDFYAFVGTTRMGTVDADIGVPCITPIDYKTEPATATITHDFSGFAIDLRSDDEGVYFPFTLANDLFENDDTFHRADFNGEKIFVNKRSMLYSIMMAGPEFYKPLFTKLTREQDLIDYSYAEWCYAMQHLYGYPGSEGIDETILREEGLEAALKAQGSVGEKCIELLKSADMGEYMAGTLVLNMLFDDGHSNLSIAATSMMDATNAPELQASYTKVLQDLSADEEFMKFNAKRMDPLVQTSNDDNGRAVQRSEALGEGHYFAKGDTALVSFDVFHGESDAWKEYYASEDRDLDALLKSDAAEIDTIMIFLNALREAEADPNIKNIVIDLTNNYGGDSSVLITIMSLINGNSTYHYTDVLTGQDVYLTYDIDRNFDGEFDEKDDEVSYDFNFAVLTSAKSFSCANALASMMKDTGMPVLGEQSRGGSCMVAVTSTAEGFEYTLSGYRARLANDAGENINGGIPIDIDLFMKNDDGSLKTTEVGIEAILADGTTQNPYIMRDYSQFWDLDVLSEAVNDYYAVAEAA